MSQLAELIPAEALAEIDRWVAQYPADRKASAVLAALTIAQDRNGGWLCAASIEAVAEYLAMPVVAVAEVASFYSMFDLKPVGRHKISVCNNISCWLRGANDIIAQLERKLGIRVGETTADGRITLKREEECLAACAGAPMMAVDGHYHENLTPERVAAIVDALD